MAAWRHEGEDKGSGGGIEREKQREKEGERNEREGGIEEDWLPV